MGMTRGTRTGLAAVLALAAAVALAGCTETEALVGEALMNAELDGLTTDLEKLDGVEVTHTMNMSPEYDWAASVEITVDDPSPDALDTIVDASAQRLGNDVFKGATSLTITSNAVHVFYADGIAPSEALDTDIGYWIELRETTGEPLSLTYRQVPETDEITRLIASATPVDLAALSAIDDPRPQGAEWSFPGLDAYGSLPDAAAITLFTGLTELMPPLDWVDPGVQLQWSGDQVTRVTVLGGAEADAASLVASDFWPVLAQLVELSTGEAVEFTYYDSTYTYLPMVHFRECELVAEANEWDIEFFDALVAQGVALPPEAAPGGCRF